MASSGQQYVLVVEAAESAEAVADAVKRALADPAVMFYGALRSHANVQLFLGESTDAAHASLLQLLDVMAYGTVTDLSHSTLATSGVRALITANLTDRLRELSVLSFCATTPRREAEIPYDALAAFLGVSDDDALEGVLRNAISHRLLKARLNPQRRGVYVEEFASRCVRAKDVTALKLKLQEWLQTVDGQLSGLEAARLRCSAATAP